MSGGGSDTIWLSDFAGVLKADGSLRPSPFVLGIVVNAKLSGLEGLLLLLGRPGAKACLALVSSTFLASKSDEGGSAAACSLKGFMFEADFTAGHNNLETLLFLCFFGPDICGGGKSFASMSGNSGDDISCPSLAACSILLLTSQKGLTGWSSTAVASIGKISTPFVEDELAEPGMVAVVVIANVPFSLRLLHQSRLEKRVEILRPRLWSDGGHRAKEWRRSSDQ